MNISIVLIICLAAAVTEARYPSKTTPTPTCRYNQYRCPISRKCIPNDAICDGEVDCNGDQLDNSDELNCRPHFCDDELVLNYTTIGTLFQASFSDSGKCGGLVTPRDVTLAFRGSGSKFIGRCPEYDIIINVTASTYASYWLIGNIAYKTDNIESTTINIDGVKFKHTETAVNQVVNQTGSGLIVIHVKATTDSRGKCVQKNSVCNIEIVLCRPPPDTTTPEQTTPTTCGLGCLVKDCNLAPIVLPVNTSDTDSLGNICYLTTSASINYCNGSVASKAVGNSGFTNASGVRPPGALTDLLKTCVCCDGNSTWKYYPVACYNPITNAFLYNSYYGIVTMTSCDSLPCQDKTTVSRPSAGKPIAQKQPVAVQIQH